MRVSGVNILEIGDHHHFKQTYPAQTTLLWTGYRPPKQLQPNDYLDCTPRRLAHALRNIRRRRYDLVVVYAGSRAPWHPRYWLRSLLHTPFKPVAALTRVFGIAMLRLVKFETPLVALDMHDAFSIDRSNFFLLDDAKYYFKRELPVDAWQAIYGSAHPNLPTSRIRRTKRWQDRLAKLRPISLQAGVVDIGRADPVFAGKTTDVFFAGSVDLNSTLRRDGIAQLKLLADRGIRVDIPTERLPQEEYYSRMSRAWLAWSPSGRGWDCYRHYEAPQCLAVPIINYPTILRYMPLEDGRHAIYYAPEGDGLTRAIEEALLDRDRLKRIALAGRQHVQAHHAGRAYCDRIIAMTLTSE